MTPAMFNGVTNAIERQLDAGEGYTLNLRTKAGNTYLDYAWQGFTSTDAIIELSKPDMPPVWLLVGEIESVELVS